VLLQNKESHSSQTVSGLKAKLANKVYNNLISLSSQFADELSKNINFIIKKSNSAFLTDTKTVNTKLTTLANLSLYPFSEGIEFKVIKLINKQLALLPSIGQKGAYNSLTLVKEALKAYNYGINIKKNGFISAPAGTGLIGTADNVNKFKLLGILLTKIFKTNVDVQLIRVHNAGLDSEILAKVIALNARGDKTSTLLKKV
jgi:hypothetical protein